MNTVSVNSLTRKHLVIHNSIKLHRIHTHQVMNIIHWDICANHYIVLHLMQAFFTFNGNTLQRMYFNADLPWVLPVRKGTLTCMHSREPGGFIIYCCRVEYSWKDCRKLSQTLKHWALLILSKQKALYSFKDTCDCEFTGSFTKKHKG